MAKQFTRLVTDVQHQLNNDFDALNVGESSPSSSSSSTKKLNPSITIVILIVSAAIILSASLYLFLRFFNRYCSRSPSDDVVNSLHQHNRPSSRRVSPEDNNSSLINSLPLFTFASVTARNRNATIVAGDCAICLSKFEPHDQLRLLPICCHAFHSGCIDPWLASNDSCPICRTTIHVSESDVLKELLSSSANGSDNFRIEIGSVSRRGVSDSGRRSYSIGSFDYVIDEAAEFNVDTTSVVDKDKDDIRVSAYQPEALAAEVSSGRGWFRDYVDRWTSTASISLSSRALSFRSSGRFFTGSSRRSDVAGVGDLEAGTIGEEISEFFRWISGV